MEKEERIKMEIYELTMLIGTAREEGDEDEHIRVVEKIMEIIKSAPL